MQRSQEAADASAETHALMLQHNVEEAGELAADGIELPMEAFARRMFRLYNEGEIDDEDLDELGIAIDDDGGLLLKFPGGQSTTMLP